MTKDIEYKVNSMGKEECQQEAIVYSDMCGNTMIEGIELGPGEHGTFDDDDSKKSKKSFLFNED